MGTMNNKRLMIKVCELYYIQNKSQKEISAILGISRPQICRLITAAKEGGIVNISISNPYVRETELENRLIGRFGIRHCSCCFNSNIEVKERLDMDFTEYIKPELLILVPVLYVIGMAIKKTALIADKLIPLAVGAAGILLSIIYVLATSDLGSPQAVAMAIFTALTQGVLVSGASVYANQIFKQFKGSGTKDDSTDTEQK